VLGVDVLAAEGPLGALAPQNVVLLRRQLLAPLRLGYVVSSCPRFSLLVQGPGVKRRVRGCQG
ncbi:MAG TPA: hypothetical protein VGL78_08965, partial [Solirubrobacteraceae bacterium]